MGGFRVFWPCFQKNRQKDPRDPGSLFFARINGNFFIGFRNHNVEKITKNDFFSKYPLAAGVGPVAPIIRIIILSVFVDKKR